MHPLRTSTIEALLEKGGGSMALADELLASGELRRLEHTERTSTCDSCVTSAERSRSERRHTGLI